MSDILYLGDTSLSTAAAYLAGVLHHHGWSYDYIPSDRSLTTNHMAPSYRLYVLSDYMSQRFPVELQQRLIERVQHGAGLLMIGGWESYHGLGGNWDGSPVAEALPVEISTSDDRVNCDHPVFVRRTNGQHPITDGLPWDERPPLIGGFNRFRARPTAQTLLETVAFSACLDGHTVTLTKKGSAPLLVVGTHGQGRVAALATDVAPHWVGPWVDWGAERVQSQGPGAGEVEVGCLYSQFLHQLVEWAAGGVVLPRAE